MKGKRTLFVLGAGASACHENKDRKIPTQNDILNSFVFPKLSRSSPKMIIGGLVTGNGLTHSTFLSDYLASKYKLEQNDENMLTEYWEMLAKRKLNLETLYDELEADASKEGLQARNDFIAILMAKIRSGVGDRSQDDLCKNNLKIARNLEPLDYVITFNWDTLIDDALLYGCPFWYPYTGYGTKIAGLQGEFFNKKYHIDSLVHIYHIHGSIGLYEPIDEEIRNRLKTALVVGPKGLCIMYELCELIGIKKPKSNKKNGEDIEQPKPARNITAEEQALLDRGCIRIGEEKKIWLQPIFVTPSKAKREYNNWYVTALKKIIYTRLPFIERIIIAGYSFPPSDYDHLKSIFIDEIISDETEIMCINLENKDQNYQEKVKQIFKRESIDFSISDFKEYCNNLPL